MVENTGVALGVSRWGTRLKDALLLIAVVLAAGTYFDVPLPRSPRRIVVGPAAPNPDASPMGGSHARVLQNALDPGRSGDTIVLRPGTYRERLVIRKGGRPGAPLVIRAEVPGTAVISGAAKQEIVEALDWVPRQGGRYAAAIPWRLYRIRYAGEELFPFSSLQVMDSLTGRPGAMASFVTTEDTVHVWLPGGRMPDPEQVVIHGPLPAALANGEWRAANVWIEADHVRLEGIHFDFGVGFGVRVFAGTEIAVVESLITGSGTGVNAVSQIKPSTGLRVARSAFHNYPQGDWGRWLTWREAYDGAGEVRFLTAQDDGLEVAGNLVIHAGDGFHVTTGDVPIAQGLDVTDNLIAYCTDDAVEFDGFAKHVRFRRNLVYDCYVSLGTSPVLAGPVTVTENLFLHPWQGLNGAHVKLLTPWAHRAPPLNGPIRNIDIRDNTFVGNWLAWYGSPATAVEDVRLQGNTFAVQHARESRWPPGVEEEDNRYVALPVSGYANPGTDPRWFSASAERPRWSMRRPGPSWLDWRSHPATRRLLNTLSSELFTR